MARVILWKRAKEGGKPMSERDEPAAPSESDVAHSYVQHIGHEYARLRARLHKLEQSKDENVTKADIGADTNHLALTAFDKLAADLRKCEPHLTKEQAFAKVYSDPKHVDLRRLERNSAYEAIGAPWHYDSPVQKSVSVEESGAAYQQCMKLAEAAFKKDSSKSIAQHFSKIYESSEELRRQDIAERNVSKAGYPPVAETEPVIGATDGYEELCRMAEEFRQNNPYLSFAEAFARVGEANPDLMQREKKDRYARMGL